MAEQISFLIIGNGIAGITAAETLQAEAPTETIGIIAEDNQPVYYRPALKDYLAERVGVDKLRARPAGYYKQHDIHFLVDRVGRIAPENHTVFLRSGGQVRYKQLLLATGGRATKLTCPGAELEGVITLRSLEDYERLVQQLATAQHVVVSGSGTLAIETIETLRGRGLQVTHLVRKRLLCSEVLDATASDLVLQEEQRAGVDVRLESEIVEIEGSQGAVTGVVTNGGERIACDLVVVAIGITPNIDYARASGITCQRGVLVDEQWRTNQPDIYAAGDVIESFSQETGQGRLLGQWYPAIQQARAAAFSMLGVLDTKHPFRTDMFYNATFLYGLPFASVGITNAPGYRELVADPQPRVYRKLLLRDDVPVGLLALGDRKQTLAFKRAIDHRVNLASVLNKLFEEDFDVAGWLDQRGIPPLQLGVQRLHDSKMATGVVEDAEVEDAAHMAVARPAVMASGQAHGTSGIQPGEQLVGENLMLDELTPSDRTEAFMVHIVDPQLPLRIAETLLSRDTSMLIGRQPGVDILVNEGSVSRRHAQISYRDRNYTLCDLDSLNGTYLNDQRLEPQRQYSLRVNDVIRYGNVVKFRFLLRALSLQELVSSEAPPKKSAASATAVASAAHAVAGVSERTQRAPVVRPNGVIATSSSDQQLPSAIVNALKMQPALIVLPADVMQGQKQSSPRVYMLQPDQPMIIGRVKDNDIVLNDIVVSRQHAQVFATPEGFFIRDLGSSNGVIINQSKVEQPYRLSHGDHITIGTTVILFVDLQSGNQKTASVRSSAVVSRVNQDQPVGVASPVRSSVSPRVELGSVAVGQSRQTRSTLKLPVKIVICPQCGLANMPIARFCASCSAQLRS
jgi:NADPH-dependent 2,4-dienoyl-CoA reductase/sulfur reductase-like enzyme/pSer/pThr/pTyr-binding forkhead associated (FHA) protein